jgi:hypothetical protein
MHVKMLGSRQNEQFYMSYFVMIFNIINIIHLIFRRHIISEKKTHI